MSITNYFGKPRAKYVPYKSPYTFDNLPNSNILAFRIKGHVKKYCNPANNMNPAGMTCIEITSEELKIVESEYRKIGWLDTYLPQNLVKSGNMDINYDIISNVSCMAGQRKEFSIYKLTNIRTMFNEVIEECLKWIEYPIWMLLNIPPPISIYQIILLRLHDVTKQVEHHESTIDFLVNDNTLLNNRIKALENSIALLIKKSHIPVAEPVDITVAEAVLKY